MKTKSTPQTLNLRLSSAGAVAVAAVSGDVPRRFSGIANSGRPFVLGAWQTVIDFDGIRLKDKTAFLIDHEGGRRAGAGRLSVTSDGLFAEGILLNNEYGRAVAEESDQGFPWEMSVYVQSARVEELSAGAKTSVNGREVQGPMLIMRDCAVREVSFTAVGVDGNTHAVALSDDGKIAAFDYQPKQEHLSMTPEEKAELEQLKADKAKLEQENADLKLSAHKAQIDAKLSAAGFRQEADGKFSGVGESTYRLLLSAGLADAEAVIADLKPAEAALSGAGKPPVPEALLADKEGGRQTEPEGLKLSAATGKSSFNGGAYV